MKTYASRDGTSIACFSYGKSGPPLLLIHGASTDHVLWDPVLPLLSPHFRVFAIDRRGRGESGDAPDYEITHEFADVASVVEGIGEPIDVVAHSFGALCALEATLLTDRIHRLVLYESPLPGMMVHLPSAVRDEMLALLAAGEKESVVCTFLRARLQLSQAEIDVVRALPNWPRRVQLAHTIPRELQALDEYAFDVDRLSRVTAEVTLFLGESSPPHRRKVADALLEALPTASLVSLPGQGHGAIRLAPELFSNNVLACLRR